MALAYRVCQEKDLLDLQRLWAQDSTWGTWTLEWWRRWFVDGPHGAAVIVIAKDRADRLIGQFLFVPGLVAVKGRQVRTFRPFAPIVAEAARDLYRSPNPLNHPVVGMYRHAVEYMRAQGAGLIYMVPDPRWLRLFRMFPMLQCGSFPLWSLPLPLATPLSLPAGYTAGPLQAWDERIDRLWDVASRLHGCSIVRDSRMLRWKIGQGEYSVLAVERTGELVGLVASQQKGDAQWLVCDLLAADAGDSLRATLMAATNLGHAQTLDADPARPIRKVALLATPVMQPVVQDLGFVRDVYDFPLAVHILDPMIRKEDVAPAAWYVSAND